MIDEDYVAALERGHLRLAAKVDRLRNKLKVMSCILANKEIDGSRRAFVVEHYEQVIARIAQVATSDRSPNVALETIVNACRRAREIPE